MAELWDILDENGNRTGRLHERGQPMRAGEWHLVVQVWILNSKGEFLISKRSPDIPFGNLWQTTGGSAVAGDDSLTTALKETREELGIALDPENGELFTQYQLPHSEGEGSSGGFFDVWLFRQEAGIEAVRLCPEETIDAKWANSQEITRLRTSGEFLSEGLNTYLSELFNHCGL